MKKLFAMAMVLVLAFGMASAFAETVYEEFIYAAEISTFQKGTHVEHVIEYGDEDNHIMWIEGYLDGDTATVIITRNGETTFNEIITGDRFDTADDAVDYMWLLNALVYDGWL